MKFNLALFLALTAAVAASTNETSPSHSANLEPIAFFTAHVWEAQLPDRPEGKKRKIHAQFTWTRNGQAIRISNQFITDGKPSPYVDGLYAWDPQTHVIVFWYVGAEGNLTKGTVKLEEGRLVHEFQETEISGKTASYVAKVTPHGTNSWDNEIFAQRDNGLTPIVKVTYQAVQ